MVGFAHLSNPTYAGANVGHPAVPPSFACALRRVAHPLRSLQRMGYATVGIEIRGIPPFAKKREGPRISYCAAPAMAACAAFFKESRMRFVDPNKPYRKSGGMGHPGFCCTLTLPAQNVSLSELI